MGIIDERQLRYMGRVIAAAQELIQVNDRREDAVTPFGTCVFCGEWNHDEDCPWQRLQAAVEELEGEQWTNKKG